MDQRNPEDCCQIHLVLVWLSLVYQQAVPFCKLKGLGKEDVFAWYPYPIE